MDNIKLPKQTTTKIIKVRTSLNKFLVLRLRKSAHYTFRNPHKINCFSKISKLIMSTSKFTLQVLIHSSLCGLPGNLSLTPRRHFSLICIGCGVLFQSTFQRLPLLPPYWPSANIKSPYMAWNRKIDANQTQ